jgi:hypothetical protein
VTLVATSQLLAILEIVVPVGSCYKLSLGLIHLHIEPREAIIQTTLYAVWNNRIIKQEQITDDLLIADFYAWSKHKADFEEARVRKALNYMRDNNIIPVGWGKYIDKR